MLTVGIKHSEKFIVLYEHTAKNIQSGGLEVLATPALIGFMEKCAWQSVLPMMNEGFDTVGISIDMKHLSPTPVDMEVWCESELININDRELTFHINAYDSQDKIGDAIHKRFIINTARFMKKATHKSNKN
jgi:predicted thioesterase